MTKRCAWCAEEFDPNRSYQKYCSEACGDDAAYDRKLQRQRERRRFQAKQLKTTLASPPLPFLFCRHGDCEKCPGVVAGQGCPCDHHAQEQVA